MAYSTLPSPAALEKLESKLPAEQRTGIYSATVIDKNGTPLSQDLSHDTAWVAASLMHISLGGKTEDLRVNVGGAGDFKTYI